MMTWSKLLWRNEKMGDESGCERAGSGVMLVVDGDEPMVVLMSC